MTLSLSEVALRTPVTVLPETAIGDAEQQLIARESGEIYIVDADERLLGVVSDNEILKYRLLGGDGQGRISTLMSPASVFLDARDSLDAGARMLREHVHTSIPILAGGRLIGQLCRANLLRILSQIEDIPDTQPSSIMAPYLPKPKFLVSSPMLQASHTPGRP